MDCLQRQRVRIVAAYADELKLRPRSKTSSYFLGGVTLDKGREQPSCF
jgi:hypothetical protein